METRFWAEMETEPNLQICRTEIIEQLARCSSVQFVRRLGLNDEFLVDNEINALDPKLLALREPRLEKFAKGHVAVLGHGAESA